MQRVLTIQNSCAWSPKTARGVKMKRKAAFADGFLSQASRVMLSGRAGIGATIATLLVVGGVVFSGALYLYQVNSLATKGFELREVEKKIQQFEQEGNRLKIQEVELKSMYNIEKSAGDMNLVKTGAVSYVDMAGPVAMK